MKQWELDTVYEAIDQLEGHASHTLGADHAHRIAMKANNILKDLLIEPELSSEDYAEDYSEDDQGSVI